MKAIVRNRYGPPEILELQEIDRPVPAESQVLVKVRAASVNAADWHILRGQPFFMRFFGFGIFKPKRPVIGLDLAGCVEAVGSKVTQFKVGDEVFGSSLGAFAEYACLREKSLALKPANVSFEQAAATPIAGLTALQGLRDCGRIQAGQNVLITGAGGGVGSFAVQIAKSFGARVTGVCNTNRVELVKSLGADQVIDYTKEDFWRREEKYDLILDNAAFYSVFKPLRALAPDGIYVPVGGSMTGFLVHILLKPYFLLRPRQKVVSILAVVKQTDLQTLAELLESGKVVPAIGSRYALSKTPDALRYVEQGHTRGKAIISIAE